jgi:hypothetical protein
MDPLDRSTAEAVLSRIPHDERGTFLESLHGRRFATRLETVRESFRALGQLPQGAPPKPVAKTVDLLGQRLLLDHSAGPWLRTAILRAMPPDGGALCRVLYVQDKGPPADVQGYERVRHQWQNKRRHA